MPGGCLEFSLSGRSVFGVGDGGVIREGFRTQGHRWHSRYREQCGQKHRGGEEFDVDCWEMRLGISFPHSIPL